MNGFHLKKFIANNEESLSHSSTHQDNSEASGRHHITSYEDKASNHHSTLHQDEYPSPLLSDANGSFELDLSHFDESLSVSVSPDNSVHRDGFLSSTPNVQSGYCVNPSLDLSAIGEQPLADVISNPQPHCKKIKLFDPITSSTSCTSISHNPTKATTSLPNTLVKHRYFKERQNRIKPEDLAKSKANIIDVDTYNVGKKHSNTNYWLPTLNLTVDDKAILLSATGLLNDSLINAAQKLLANQFPTMPGLQDVLNGPPLSFDIEAGEFIQILNTQTGHWLTISTIGNQHPIVSCYDSIFRSAGTNTKVQIASLLHTRSPNIILNFLSTQKQLGGIDCGIFAIANATVLCLGEKPGKFHYDQAKMRKHLITCLEQNKMTCFPILKHRRQQYHHAIIATESFKVYCICRLPEMLRREKWIECSHCKEWFHYDTCVPVPNEARNKSVVWKCCNCKA